MDITYFGLSSFKIKSKGVGIIIDPFDSDIVGIKYPNQEADIVIVTGKDSGNNNLDRIKNSTMVIKGPGEYEVKGVTILGYGSRHGGDKAEGDSPNTMYVIETEGIRILHLGYLKHGLSEKDIEKFGEINILLVPVGGLLTLDAKQASEVARLVDSNITVPMLYKCNGLKGEFENLSPVEDFLSMLPLTVEKTDKLSLKANELGEERNIVVLSA